MRISKVVLTALVALSLPAIACGGATDAPATLVLTTEPDFSGSVAMAYYESGMGASGEYAQYDIWVTIPPATSANAGVILPTSAPVFLQNSEGLWTASGSDLRSGDQIQVWRDPTFVVYGSPAGPPGSLTYNGTQIVIVR